MTYSGLFITKWCDRVPLFQLTSALLLLFFVSPVVGFLLGVDSLFMNPLKPLVGQSILSGILVLLLLAIPAVVFFIQVLRPPPPPQRITKLPPIAEPVGSIVYSVIEWVRQCNGRLQTLPIRNYLLGLVLLTVALRFAIILLIPSIPRSDFMDYHRIAIQVSHLIPNNLGQIYFGGRALTFELMLGVLYRLAGPVPIVAKIANVILGVIFVLLIFGLTRISLDEQTARIAGFLAALLPSQIMMTTTVASEHLFTVLILLSLIIVVKGVIQKHAGFTWLFGAGLILGIAYTVRFIAVAVWLAVLIYLFCTCDRKIKDNVTRILPFVVGFIIVVASLSGLIFVTQTPGLPTQGFEYSFMTGTNFSSSGGYNDWVIAQINSWPPESVRQQALLTGFHQIIDSPGQFCILLIKKVAMMWGGDYQAVGWVVLNDTPGGLQPILPMAAIAVLGLITQVYYMGLLLLGSAGAYLLSGRSNRTGLYVYPLILVVIFAVHSLLEVQQRYHFPFEFVIIILAAWALSRQFEMRHAKESLP